MKIVVCVKQIPDPASIRFDTDTGKMANICYVMNPPDEVAVCEAIRIKERAGEGNVTIVSLGPARVGEALRSCLTMGVDEAIHLLDAAFDNLDAYAVSMVLARTIAKLRPDLILCGTESADEGSGFVGAGLAEWLDLPLVISVSKLDITPNVKSVVVQRRLMGGAREIVECPIPAVLAVDVSLGPVRRFPLKTILAGLNKKIVTVDARSLTVEDMMTATDVLSIEQPKPRLKKTAVVDSKSSASERLKKLLSGGVTNKPAKAVEKHPEAAASEIVRFLVDNGIVPGTSKDGRQT